MQIRLITSADQQALSDYFRNLSEETRRRFGPHPFDEETTHLITNGQFYDRLAYIALEGEVIIAYAIVQPGYVRGDAGRYEHYDITLDYQYDYTIAPSVADAYQGQGIGSRLFQYVEADLRARGARRIVLWGGVQLTNLRAVKFYLKHGFRTLGEFEHNGRNLDMVKTL